MPKAGQVASQAQAQAQGQQEAITSVTESLELVRCLLRVSVFHVAFLRGLFPDSFFRGTSMDNLEGMEIKMLRPKCKDSQRLIDWVEHGVHDAIKKMYLETLFFGIATNAEGTDLLEEYVFSFAYDTNGAVSIRLTAKGKPMGGASASQASVTSVRYQVIRLMRMLVQLCNTLEQVPEERYLFMKLAYNDTTPEDYEPPYFAAKDDPEPAHFARRPFSMEVGSIATNFHAVSLKLKSILDGCEPNDNDQVYNEQQDSALVSNGNSGWTTSTPSGPKMGRRSSAACIVEPGIPEEQSSAQQMSRDAIDTKEADADTTIAEKPGSNASPAKKAQPAKSQEIDMTCDPALDEVMEYCLHQEEVQFDVTAMHFKHMDTDDLTRALDQLIIEGVLKKTRANNFRVCKGSQAEAEDMTSKPAQRETAAGRAPPQPNTASEPATDRPAAGKPGPKEPRFDPALREVNGMNSEQGRASMFAGSLQSGQPSGPPPPVSHGIQSENVIFDSQQSDEGRTKRKASFVAEPIHQKRRTVARTRSRLNSMRK